MARGDLLWHTPANAWYSGAPNVGGDITNTDVDLFQVLVQLDDAGALTIPDAAGAYICERIVGQYMLTGSEVAPQQAFMHHRVYVTTSDSTSVALRDLTADDEVESSFLWHQVDPWAAVYDSDIWGNWQTHTSGNPAGERYMGRFGHVDIRVKRKIERGEALVWHTQIKAAAVPADDTYTLKLWLRCLLKES